MTRYCPRCGSNEVTITPALVQLQCRECNYLGPSDRDNWSLKEQQRIRRFADAIEAVAVGK
jgi:RNA polymerase subunit RPABC4/transcription elongation factor Spt4